MLDATNRRILEELQYDARLSMAELSRRVNLSSQAVSERVQRLERDGVIRGYHADIDPVALGYSIAAVVRVAPASSQLERIRQVARETPEVVECHRITGEDCFFLKLHLRTIDDLEGLLDRFTPFGRTTTSIIHSSPIDGRPLPIHRTHRKHAEAMMEFSDGVQHLVGRSTRPRARSEHSDGATWIDP